MALPWVIRAMKVSSCKAVQQSTTGWVAFLILLFGLAAATELQARDRNPWAVPDPRAPAPTFQPPSDGRFAPQDYDPVNDRRRRPARPGEFVQPDVTGHLHHLHPGLTVAPESLGFGLHDPLMGVSPWSGLHGIPGLTGYPGLYPYGVHPGSGILWPGTGLTTPGLGWPLHGSPLGTVPLLGAPY